MSERVNPANPVPAEIETAFRRYRDERRAAVARRHEIVALTGPTDEERTAMVDAYTRIGEAAGVDVEQVRRIGTDRASRLTRSRLEVVEPPVIRPPVDWQPLLVSKDDPDFWWSSTDFILPDDGTLASWGTLQPFRAAFQADGLHFTGMLTHESGSLHSFSFGADALFAISWDRVPQSSLNRWHSSPYVELFGGIDGWTVPPSFPDGDHWSKCWMYRRQTLLQFLFGPTGPVPVVMGEAIESTNLISNEGAGYDSVALPGHQAMPQVVVGNLYPQTVWAHLEVRFDVQLEGDAGLWITPPGDILLRTFQWPLVPFLNHPTSPFHP